MTTTKKPVKTKDQKVTIKVNEEAPETLEIIADSIIRVADAFEKIKRGRLSQRALIILIKDACGSAVNFSEIEIILNTIPKLKDKFIR